MFHEHLEAFEKTLKDRDRKFFHERLLNEEPKTLQELGDSYGISRERARQIEAGLIDKLRKFVSERGVIDVDVIESKEK